MARQNNRFTVYDMMEAKGVFEANSANPGSRADDGTPLYNGPVEFPMMVYHPMGKTRVLVPGMVEVTPWGPQVNGELKEIIHKVVGSKAELTAALAEGWHRHPAHAISAGGGRGPPDLGRYEDCGLGGQNRPAGGGAQGHLGAPAAAPRGGGEA